MAALLKGVRMPCDLAPVTGGHQTVAHTAGLLVAFATANIAPAEIGRAVGDELERLDYTLTSTSSTQVQATRGDDVLLVTLVTDPAEAMRDGQKAYPTLPPNSVVVEFESA